VVITGASGLIGGECVDAFARQGDRVAAIDVVAPPWGRPDVFNVTADLRDDGELERAFDAVHAALGPVDVLVQCAAVVHRTPFLDLTAADVDAVFAVNVRALLLAARCAAVSMIEAKRHGVIVNLSSTSAPPT
jgi:NAD(P)-dependent dehydrogenase (short-subunit alcohol dehydrogenase family)